MPVCVNVEIYCTKLKILSMSRILDTCWSVGQSKEKLKSPKINRHPVMELQYSRNADSCSTNRESVSLFSNQVGRSVETETVDRSFSNDSVAWNSSKELCSKPNEDLKTMFCNMWDRAMIARPPPLFARGKDLVAYPEGVRSAIFYHIAFTF